MKESRKLEFKSTFTNSFLKTVSAFCNFGDGEIWFGLDDDGNIIGVSEPKKMCLDIENKINDSIAPKPDFTLYVDGENNTICLSVREGQYKPYLYKGKAYRRSDTASVEVDQAELRSLVLEGSNLYFEELPCEKGDLAFQELSTKLMEALDISVMSNDILRTLGLFTRDKRYNNAAALLADENDFFGIDMARFGKSINEIMDRETTANTSILKQYDRAVSMVKRYYQYEKITGIEREKVELIPENAFREAIANALIHRDWSINAHIRISMFEDRIEIKSPGGLPLGITMEEYLNGDISCLRNPVLGNIFFRLRYVEMFGTGIKRIIQSYEKSVIKPKFQITDNVISVILPVIAHNYDVNDGEAKIINILNGGKSLSSSEISKLSGYTKSKVLRVLEGMKEKDYIKVVGKGRGTKYTL